MDKPHATKESGHLPAQLLEMRASYAVLIALYWRDFGTPRRWGRRTDTAILTAAALLAVVATVGTFHVASTVKAGPLWPDVASALAGIFTFPMVLLGAWVLRQRKTSAQSSP